MGHLNAPTRKYTTKKKPYNAISYYFECDIKAGKVLIKSA